MNGANVGARLEGNLAGEFSLGALDFGEVTSEFGLFAGLTGEIGVSGIDGDVRGGFYTGIENVDGKSRDNFTSRSFIERALDGKFWIGLAWEYVNQRGQFLKGEYKARWLETEKEASGVTNGIYNYWLGKMLIGTFSAGETKALSPFYVQSLAAFFATQTVKSVNMIASAVDAGVKQIVEFSTRIQPKLAEIYHNHLHAAPVVSAKLKMTGGNQLALDFQEREAPRAENASQHIFAFGKEFFNAKLSDIFRFIVG